MMALLGLTLSVSAQEVQVLDPGNRQQGFEGWGASLCWWANGAGRWTDANLDALVGRLADADTGLGYSIFRYNIGGGDQPGHNHFRQYGDIPGYKPTASGEYDWTADPYQRKVAQRLASKVPGAIWEAFSNSPPWWMTKSGCAAGSVDGSDNLQDEFFQAFADYQSEVAKHFQESWGITFRTVEPFNEPSPRWWKANGNQEGCGFKDNQPRMVKLLGKSLKDKGLIGVSVSASDENSIADAVARFAGYDDSALGLVTQMNVHSYAGKESRAAFAALGRKQAKRTWQSESGPLTWPGGNQLDVSLWMADVIIQDLKTMRVNAWLDWQPLDGGVWGSFTTNFGLQSAVPNKRFYMHAQFSRFIRPGSEILAGMGNNVLAALAAPAGGLVVVILNPDSVSVTHLLDATRFARVPASASVYRTSATQDMAKLPDAPLTNGMLSFAAPARSINTLILPGATSSLASPSTRRSGLKSSGGFTFDHSTLLLKSWSGLEPTDISGRRTLLLPRPSGP